MTTTLADALQNAEDEHNDESRDWTGLCLMFVRMCWEIPARYPSAAAAWHAAEDQRFTYPPPPGAAVFWTGGSQGYGHIALSTGDGYCWSTDILHRGQVDHVTIGFINANWSNEHYVGWTGDLNGVDLPLGLEGEGEDHDPIGDDMSQQDVDEIKAELATTRGKVELSINEAREQAAEVKAAASAAGGRAGTLIGAADRTERYLLIGDKLAHITDDAWRVDLQRKGLVGDVVLLEPAVLDWMIATYV